MSFEPENMSPTVARTTPPVVLSFYAYSLDIKSRINAADATLREGEALLGDLEATNARLSEVGRPDLVIADRAEMMPVNTPAEMAGSVNNFMPNFVMRTGVRETGELNFRDEPVLEAIPPTEEDLDAFKDAPRIGDFEDKKAVIETGEYPLFGANSHARKPAFLRMLNLFPDFTKKFVIGISDPANGRHYDRFEPELFVAYQLMSQLIDKADAYVVRDNVDVAADGVDDWYLCR